jgi:hypothetical protein
MPRDDLVGHGSGEAAVAAVRVEAEQVVAVGVRLADPEFPDVAAGRQRIVHRSFSFMTLRVPNPDRGRVPSRLDVFHPIDGALQQSMNWIKVSERLCPAETA